MAFFCVTVVCIFNYSSKCFLFFENSPQVHCFVFPLSTIMNYGTSNIRSGVGLQYIFMHNKIHNVTQDMHVCVCVFSHVQLFVTPWTVAHQALCWWDFPCKNTRVGCHSLLQGIFPTQRSNLGLPHCRWNFNHLNHQGSPPQPGHKVLSSVGCNALLFTTAGMINPEHTQNLSSYPSSLQT